MRESKIGLAAIDQRNKVAVEKYRFIWDTSSFIVSLTFRRANCMTQIVAVSALQNTAAEKAFSSAVHIYSHLVYDMTGFSLSCSGAE